MNRYELHIQKKGGDYDFHGSYPSISDAVQAFFNAGYDTHRLFYIRRNGAIVFKGHLMAEQHETLRF